MSGEEQVKKCSKCDGPIQGEECVYTLECIANPADGNGPGSYEFRRCYCEECWLDVRFRIGK